MKKRMTLGEAIECAATHLPIGWQIQITVEAGWAGVKAIRPDKTEVEIEDCDGEVCVCSLVCEAMQLAKDESNMDAISTANNSGVGPRAQNGVNHE